VPLSVTLEHSADGQNWQQKNHVPEISGTVPYAGGTIVFYGGERWPALPSQRFARLCLNVGGSVGAFAFHVLIHAVNRTRVSRAPRPAAHSHLPGDATLFGARREALTEIQSVLSSTTDALPADRAELLLRRLSPEAHRELHTFQTRLASLDPEAKRAVLQAATLAIGAVMLPRPLPLETRDAPKAAACDDCTTQAPIAGPPQACGGDCNAPAASSAVGTV